MVQKASNTKVFENLTFLIRDWNFEEEKDFGFEGGDQLLQEWIKVCYKTCSRIIFHRDMT
jgi:hypothetical protein